MKIRFNRIHAFVHEYDFPVLDLLNPYKEDIINEFDKSPKIENEHNVPLYNQFIYHHLEPKLNQLIQYWYQVGDPLSKSTINLYVQDNIKYASYWHTHIFDINKSNVVCTFYLHELEEGEGGELEFALPPIDPFKIRPKVNKLYVFPNWLAHRPLPQTSTAKRICFNWGYNSIEKFIHRTSGDAW